MTSSALAPLLSFIEERRLHVRHISLRRGVENPVTGQRTRLLEDVTETGDRSVLFEFTIPPRSQGDAPHFHTRMTETFYVVSGRLFLAFGGNGMVRVLTAGESVVVPPGVLHGFRNCADAPLVIRRRVTPGDSFTAFVHATFGLAVEGRTDTRGLPLGFWHSVLFVEWGDLRHRLIPSWIQTPVVRGLARIARNTQEGRRLLASLPSSVG